MTKQALVDMQLDTPASTAAGDALDVSSFDNSDIGVMITPDFAANVVAVQQSLDGNAWFALAGINTAGAVANITATTGQAFFRITGCARFLRANVTYTGASGTPRVDIAVRPRN